ALAISRPGLTWRAGLVFAADRSKVTDLGCGTDTTSNLKTCPFYESGDVSGQGQSGVRAERVMVCDPSRPGYCPGYALGTFYGPVLLDVNPTTGQQVFRSEEHTSELQSRGQLGCRLLLEKRK